MLKKILIILLVVVGVGFASAFVRGYQYQTSKAKNPTLQKEVISKKQEMIDEEIINDILPNNDVSNKEENTSTNEVDTTNVVAKNSKDNSNVGIKKENTSNNISNTDIVEVNTTEIVNPIKEEIKETQINTSNERPDVNKANPNDFYYSFHLGKIEFDTMGDCLNAFATLNVRNDDPNLLNGTCIDVVNKYGDILGEYLYIECLSGDCNTYKNLIKDLIKK